MMGIMLTGFLGGAAKGITESIDEEEKRAATMAQLQAKAMFDNYQRVREQNAELSGKLKGGIDYLKSNGIQGTEEEYFKAAKNPQVLALLQEKVKAGGFNPSAINLAEIVGATQSLDGKTAKQYIDKAYDLGQQVYAKPEPSKQPVGLVQGFGNKAAEDTFNRTSTMLGVSPDILRATAQYKRPELDIDNTYNLSSLYANKTASQLEDEAKGKVAAALKSGDPQAIAVAQADAKVITDVSTLFSQPQQKFINMVATLKDQQLNGTPEEKKAAGAKLTQVYAQERQEALAKHVREPSDKVPALGALNSFTASAVNRALIAEYGNSKEFASERVDNGDNTFSIRLKYIGTDDQKKAQIQQTEANAAKAALSIWTDDKGRPLSRDVYAVAQSYPVPDQRRLGNVAPKGEQVEQPVTDPFKKRTSDAREKGELDTLIKNASTAGMTKEKLLSTGVTEEEYNQYVPKVSTKPLTMNEELHNKAAARLKEVNDRLNQAVLLRDAAAKSGDLESIKQYQQKVDVIQEEKDRLRPNRLVR